MDEITLQSMNRPPIEPTPIQEVKARLALLDAMDPGASSIEEIKQHLQVAMKGLVLRVPQFEPGLELYRARKFSSTGKPSNISEIGAPPAHLVSMDQRCNRAGQSMFNCSVARNAPFFEIHAQVGDHLVLSKWKTAKQLTVNHVGYTASNFQQLGSSRPSPVWVTEEESLDTDILEQQQILNQFLATRFSSNVSDGETHRYKDTIAITEQLIPDTIPAGAFRFDGIMYPTIPMAGNCENFALFPDFAFQNVGFVSAEFLVITKVKGTQMSFDVLDFANSISDTGLLNWKGRPGQWQLTRAGEELIVTSKDGEWTAIRPDGTVVLPD